MLRQSVTAAAANRPLGAASFLIPERRQIALEPDPLPLERPRPPPDPAAPMKRLPPMTQAPRTEPKGGERNGKAGTSEHGSCGERAEAEDTPGRDRDHASSPRPK